MPPGLSLAGVQLAIPGHGLGLPLVSVRFPYGHAAATTPVQQPGVVFAHIARPYQPSRQRLRVGLDGVPFEACSAFIRIAACPFARPPICDPLPEGFSHFVTS